MDAKITNSNENKANPVNYSTQGFTGDPIIGFGFLVAPKNKEGEKRYRIHRIIKEKVTLDDLLDFKKQLNDYDTADESI